LESAGGSLTETLATTIWGRRVSVASHGVNLAANLHSPPSTVEAPWPAVVLVHGLGGNRNEAFGIFIKLAASLAFNGFAVLRTDMRGAGETGGSTLDINLERQIEDTAAALNYLRGDQQIDSARLGLLGLSMGGLACACLAGRRRDVAALSIWEAPYDLRRTMTALFGPKAVSAVKIRGYLQAGLMRLGESFFDVLDDLDPAALVAGYSRPVLIVHGTGDAIVPLSASESWNEAFKAAPRELFLVQEADHAFTHDGWAWSAVERSVEWFKGNL